MLRYNRPLIPMEKFAVDEVDLSSGLYRYYADQRPDDFRHIFNRSRPNSPAAVLVDRDRAYYIPMSGDTLPVDWRRMLRVPMALGGGLLGAALASRWAADRVQSSEDEAGPGAPAVYGKVLAGAGLGALLGLGANYLLPKHPKYDPRHIPTITGIYDVTDKRIPVPDPVSQAQRDALEQAREAAVEAKLREQAVTSSLSKLGAVRARPGTGVFVDPEFNRNVYEPHSVRRNRQELRAMALGGLLGAAIGAGSGAIHARDLGPGATISGGLFGGLLGVGAGAAVEKLHRLYRWLSGQKEKYNVKQLVVDPNTGKIIPHVASGAELTAPSRSFRGFAGRSIGDLGGQIAGAGIGLAVPAALPYTVLAGEVAGALTGWQVGENLGDEGRFKQDTVQQHAVGPTISLRNDQVRSVLPARIPEPIAGKK